MLDAQNFGVPQRRRRIFALLDTGAWWSRQPILFEQEGLSGHIAQSGDEGESVAEGVEGGAGESGGREPVISCSTRQISMKISIDKSSPILSTDYKDPQVICYENHANDSRVTRCEDGIVPTLSSRMGTGGGNVPFVLTPLPK